jgi:hypothetical protein
MKFLTLFRAARRASVPLVAVRTPDAAETQRTVTEAYSQDPILSWDFCRGCQWLNAPGSAIAWRVLLEKGQYDPAPKTPKSSRPPAKS